MHKMIKKRIFTGIDLNEPARRTVAAYIKELRSKFPDLRVGWEKPAKLHLTIKFSGDLLESEIENLKTAVGETAARMTNFKIRVVGTGAFPDLKRARVLWLGLESENDRLIKTREMLEDNCEKLGLARETRSFAPHLTIGRLRDPRNSQFLVDNHIANQFVPLEFRADELVIFESRPEPAGSIYSKIAAFKFR